MEASVQILMYVKRPTNACKETYESLTVRCGLEKVKQDWEEVRIKHACI